ncbi:acyl-CoA-binding protein homolog [Sitophilus oryzae]|uniref:Acyl-CoA-binding protein homolog n=1 Tax=Sitophilus oryzae TaxID=7048 RepID=A0A6J2YEU2_SITOR|nr:acyl-CoA-binding protein homolog [Sitophilus oryzae]
MSLDEKFNVAAEKVKKFSKRPPDSDMLEIYALYKQSTVGDTNIPKPGDSVAAAKWSAWNGKKGLASSKAKEEYIAKVNTLAPKYA